MSNFADVLRAEFPKEAVGKLPRVTCRDCSQSQDKVCSKHTKSKCADCGNYITNAHIHLDYVGHAAVTDRLLKADPSWTYDIVRDPNGLPFLVQNGFSDPTAKFGIWIELEVAGTKTPGFGEGKNIKEAIGDAIRNAAMRRGVALDLWSKEDLHAEEGDPKPAAKATGSTARKPSGGNATDSGAVHRKQPDPAEPSSPSEEPKDAVAETIDKLTADILKIVSADKSGKAPKNVADVLAKHRAEITDDLDYVQRLEKYLNNLRELIGAGPDSKFQMPDSVRAKLEAKAA